MPSTRARRASLPPKVRVREAVRRTRQLARRRSPVKPPRSKLYLLGGYITAMAIGAALTALALRPRVTIESTRGPDPLRTAPNSYMWAAQPPAEFPTPPYARFLKDVKIVLDPGHGGRAYIPNFKRGPTGLREDEVNLSVARFLREFLENVGAQVIMTRDEDVYLDREMKADLRLRSEIANRERADLFLSIHHNGAETPDSNYTSVFYHGPPDHSPASQNVARQILWGVQDAMRLEQHLNCAVLSDYVVYPGEGFAVLRYADGPAVLSESSFHSNPMEESRLRDPIYNRREAYGLFVGLARWAQGGLPRVSLLDNSGNNRERILTLSLDDGLSSRGGWGEKLPKILESSIRISAKDAVLPFDFDAAKAQVKLRISAEQLRRAGKLRVDFENVFGQCVLRPWVEMGE